MGKLNACVPWPQPPPNPCHDGEDCFRSERRLGELTNVPHCSWKPHERACPTDSGSLQCKKGGVTLYAICRCYLCEKSSLKSKLLALSINAPELCISLLKRGSLNPFFLTNSNSKRNRHLNSQQLISWAQQSGQVRLLISCFLLH